MKAGARIYGYFVFFLWPITLLVAWSSHFLPTLGILGYRWTVELAFASLLFVTIGSSSLFAFRISTNIYRCEILLIVMPVALFAVWSLASMFWAQSWRGAFHHSLLWGCYGTYLVLTRATLDWFESWPEIIRPILLAVATIISLTCLLEFFGGIRPLSAAYYHRSFVNAEILITLLPIVIAFFFSHKSYYDLIVSVLAWTAVIATHSRAIFLAGIVGLLAFFALGFLKQRSRLVPRRLLAMVLLLTGTTLTLHFVFSGGEPTTFSRLVIQDEVSKDSTKLRLLFWGMAWQGFKSAPVTGMGGDNFFNKYLLLRERYSVANPEDSSLEITEGSIPERVHNEYLQILAELGIIGALLFGWFLASIAYMFWLAYKTKASLLTIGSLSGMAAFLVASTASSYSFRLPANGICFFFLLAIVSSELFSWNKDHPRKVYRLVPIIGVVVSVAMIVFSVVRANSIRYMSNAISAKDESLRTAAIENAIAIDPSEPMFRFYYGQWLEQASDHDAAIKQMRIAIDNGLADSPSFYRLAAAQIGAGRSDDAEVTFAEALRVYPRSTFLRTAYAAFLKRKGDSSRADAEYGHALAINEKQARSWQLAHDEGLERLVQTARTDDRYVSPFYLQPESAPLVVANFQRRTLPE